jgi:hypothetical protein
MAGSAHFEVYPRQTGPVNLESGGEVVEEWSPARPTGEYGWRFRAANGRIVATSGEGFTRREDAHRAVMDFLDAVDDEHPRLLVDHVLVNTIDVDEQA